MIRQYLRPRQFDRLWFIGDANFSWEESAEWTVVTQVVPWPRAGEVSRPRRERDAEHQGRH